MYIHFPPTNRKRLLSFRVINVGFLDPLSIKVNCMNTGVIGLCSLVQIEADVNLVEKDRFWRTSGGCGV
jgi:hypothetical protein